MEETPFVIVDQVYCAPVRVKLAVIRETKELTNGDFTITDDNGNLLFKPKSGLADDKMILLDGSDTPVLTMKKQMLSLHGRWQVFRGESTEEDDLLYTVKRSLMVNVKTKVDVFLSNNKEEKICDFRVKGTLFMRPCVVYEGESDNIVAEMHKKVPGGVDNFTVTVYPNVDSAFMASIVVILDHLIRQDRAYAQAVAHAAVYIVRNIGEVLDVVRNIGEVLDDY